MNKEIITSVLLVILAVGIIWLAFFITSEPPVPDDKTEYISGRIYEIKANSILVAEGITGEEYTGDIGEIIGNAGWFTIAENTEIMGVDGEELEFKELKPETKVALWVTGPVMESYPVQATASKIKVLEEVAVKECFTGGCSGELCTNEPDAISTCEYLPGAECLQEEVSCESVEGECTWVLSKAAARCFIKTKEEYGEEATETRIGYLFEKAEALLEK